MRIELKDAQIKRRFDRKAGLARKMLKSQIVKDTEKFVPMRSGYLKNSVTASLGKDDEYIVYNGPYARFLYYGYVMVGKISRSPWAKRGETKVKIAKKLTYGKVHPMACSHWFERAKTLYKDGWIKMAKKVYGNG